MSELPALIKHVGRGARLARDLSRPQAAEVMTALLDGTADAYQIGGFLLAMRMKGESAEELAGFVDALRARQAPLLERTPISLVDVDLHADGREGRPSVTVAAACVAAASGVPVLVRSAFDSAFARTPLGEAMRRLGIPPHADPARAQRAIDEAGVAVVEISTYAPRVAELLALRARLGVRTCVNSVVKLFDPAHAQRQLVGIFHSPYHAPMAGAARLLGAHRVAIVQAPGGLPEPQPDKPTRITFVDEETVPPAPLPLDGATLPIARAPVAPVAAVPTGEALAATIEKIVRAPRDADPGAVRMTIATAALMLWAAGRFPSPSDPEPYRAAEEALHSGRAAAVLDVLRSCYRSNET